MNAIINLGKYLFAIPFLAFGVFHFMKASQMAPMAFGSEILVYLTGVAHIAAAISILIGKLDKLAAVLLALMLLIFAFAVHFPNMTPENNEMANILKNIIMAGGALMYASMAKDPTGIG